MQVSLLNVVELSLHLDDYCTFTFPLKLKCLGRTLSLLLMYLKCSVELGVSYLLLGGNAVDLHFAHHVSYEIDVHFCMLSFTMEDGVVS